MTGHNTSKRTPVKNKKGVELEKARKHNDFLEYVEDLLIKTPDSKRPISKPDFVPPELVIPINNTSRILPLERGQSGSGKRKRKTNKRKGKKKRQTRKRKGKKKKRSVKK